MATVRLEYHYPEGGKFVAKVKVRDNYPDVLDEARVQAQRALDHGMGKPGVEAEAETDGEAGL